ncbi:RNA-directed DNA polymerase, eukaryota, reverse transcriptase zinc-binding domain protein [Tanacetum coccineum]|uniref:RNA-directed DNA polymerase, eukaryota, reverse transcriptase zinc-binding domain protein n=1 Tax=Tanacetum coccineum TaxID=301880 RepID=A0ABQ5D1E2_9ASTR
MGACTSPDTTKIQDPIHLIDTLLTNEATTDQVAQDEDEEPTKVLPCQLPPKELNLGSFTLPCTIGSLDFYAMADLGSSVNVMLRAICEYLKLTNLKKTNMLVEMADMTKRAPLGITENILVRIDKFLFSLDFVIIDKTPNETMILGRPFLATIHAKINVFDKEISLGIGNDRDDIHSNHAISNVPSLSPDNEKFNSLYDRSPNNVQEQCKNKKKIRLDENIPIAYFCRPIKQEYNGTLKMWPSCDPNKRGGGLSFPDFLLVRYGDSQEDDLIWDRSEGSLVKSWIIDCFEGDIGPAKDPRARSFDDYKWVLDLEIDQLANEYELGIGKKGHILEEIWENYKQVQGDDTYWWYNHWLEEDKKQEIREEVYDPPKVHLETFEVTRYSFDSGNSFVCVTKETYDTLSLGERKRIKVLAAKRENSIPSRLVIVWTCEDLELSSWRLNTSGAAELTVLSSNQSVEFVLLV